MGVREALQSGDRRAALTALRDRIAEEIDGVPCCRCGAPRRAAGSETSALTLRLMQVITELENLPSEGSVSPLDELRARRAATDSPRASQGQQRRQGGRRASGTRRPES